MMFEMELLQFLTILTPIAKAITCMESTVICPAHYYIHWFYHGKVARAVKGDLQLDKGQFSLFLWLQDSVTCDEVRFLTQHWGLWCVTCRIDRNGIACASSTLSSLMGTMAGNGLKYIPPFVNFPFYFVFLINIIFEILIPLQRPKM
jgi:hypothetical protein